MQRYLSATIYEFNKASEGYYRRWERDTAWLMREVVYTIITENAYRKAEDKPKSKKEIMELSIDKKEVVKKTPKVTKADLDIYEALNFNPKK
jgi:hypothetical protein